jgi:ribosomal-protein-serine acetyltransferase
VSAVRRLPERVAGPNGVVVRRWVPDDAEALVRAVTESAEHLRPWMPWMAHEPASVEQRITLIENWHRDWAAGGDVVMGVFVDDQVAGGSGLHRRLGPDGLEIGYWIHAGFTRRGLATLVSALLTDAAFGLPEIQRVQITHDKANLASGGVPVKLGFARVEELPDAVDAPGEVGISCHWQITRDQWRERAPLAAGMSLRG